MFKAAAAAIKQVTGRSVHPRKRRPPIIERLLHAKRESDRGNYASKNSIMRDLIHENPAHFRVDSDEDTCWA